MNRAIRRVGGAIVVLMLVLVAQLTYLQVIDADNLENDPRNVRSALRDANRPRGPIVTADGVVRRPFGERRRRHRVQVPARVPRGAALQPGRRLPVVRRGQQRCREDATTTRSSGGTPSCRSRACPTSSAGNEAVGTVVLSLRADVQRAAAQALGFQRGSVVALDVTTGKVLAMYSNPSYDPQPLASHDVKVAQAYYKALSENPDKPDLPRAYRERYPPGSTFKTVTTSVALDDGVATPETEFPQLNALDLPADRRAAGELREQDVRWHARGELRRVVQHDVRAARAPARRRVRARHEPVRRRHRAAAARHRTRSGLEHRAAAGQLPGRTSRSSRSPASARVRSRRHRSRWRSRPRGSATAA